MTVGDVLELVAVAPKGSLAAVVTPRLWSPYSKTFPGAVDRDWPSSEQIGELCLYLSFSIKFKKPDSCY